MSNIKPAGYLNKFTGMIWNPEQQPGADSEPETYEPLVRLSDVHGLVAENAAMRNALSGVLTHCPINDPDIDKACAAMICNDALQSTPNTDAFTEELRAQGVAEFAADMWKRGNELVAEGAQKSLVVQVRLAAKLADTYVDNLRAGRKG